MQTEQGQVALRDQQSGETLVLGTVTMKEARQRAVEWATNSYEPEDTRSNELPSTYWVDIAIWIDGLRTGLVTVEIDPEEPSCSGGEHDWQSPHQLVGGIEDNPGVFCGKYGAGVIHHEACVRCGAARIRETFAQRPDTGEQGVQSMSYRAPGHYDVSLLKGEE